jgi:hypothetical protein
MFGTSPSRDTEVHRKTVHPWSPISPPDPSTQLDWHAGACVQVALGLKATSEDPLRPLPAMPHLGQPYFPDTGIALECHLLLVCCAAKPVVDGWALRVLRMLR